MEPNNISREDLSYIAGLFDGEGCVHLAVKKSKRMYTLNGSCIITNTNLEVLQWCMKTIGKGHLVINQCASRINKGHKPCYRFILEQAAACELAVLLIPFLKIKGEQLKHFLSLFISRKKRPNNSAYNLEELTSFFECKRLLQENKDFIVLKKKQYSLNEFVDMIFSTRQNSSYYVFEWDDKSIALLGTASDGDVANSLNIKRHVVQKKRKELNILPFKTFRSTENYK